MKKLLNVAFIPTTLSVILTVIFAVVSLKFPGAANDWVGSLRDALFFFMQSETLLLAAGAVIFLLGVGPDSKLRMLSAEADSLECMSLMETVHERIGNSSPLFTNTLAQIVQDFRDKLVPLKDGCFTCSSEEIPRINAELYNETRQQIDAVSLIDMREYWAHPSFGDAAIEMNRLAVSRGIKITRIFIIQRKEELIEFADLLSRLRKSGVDLYYIALADTPDFCRVDFAIYDVARCVQYLSFEYESFNKRFTRTSISIEDSSIAKYRLIFNRLVKLSQRFEPDQFDIPTKDSHSLWTSGAFRNHYQGPPPELHLERIDGHYKNVLDVGCGAGRISSVFADLGCKVTGIDADKNAIAICRRRFANYKNVVLVNEEFGAESFAEECFDVIVSYNAIYHSRRQQMFDCLRHIAAIMSPMGHLLLTVKTVEGNNDALTGASSIEPNSWIGCNMPDYWAIHHFCDDREIEEITSIFGKVAYRETIPVVKNNGQIVQAAGLYLILQKTDRTESHGEKDHALVAN